jgi:hypothetical protein
MIVAMLVVAALLLVPGVGAALAVAPPGAISIEARIALAFGLGYALAASVALLLALAHVLHRPTFIAGIVLVTGAIWALALMRTSLRAHGSALAVQAREAPFALATGLALLLAIAVSRPFYPAARSLVIRSTWRYWSDGLEVASAGHVPAQTQQWGTEIPTTVSKVGLNAFEGGISFLLGPGPLAPIQAILVLTAVGLVAALLALGRELGLGIFSALVPVMTVLVPERLPLSHEISSDLKWYTAEDMGRMVAVCAVVAGIYAVRARDRWMPAAVTGALLAIGGLTHLVPVVIAGIMLAFYALAIVLADRGALGRVLKRAAVVAAVFGVVYVGSLGLSGGDLGFQRAGGAIFEGFPPNVDPTRSFTRGKFVPLLPKDDHFLISPTSIVRRLGEEVIDRSGSARLGLLLLAVLGVASAVMAFLLRPLLPVAAMAWGLLATILALALFFSFRYDTRVPGDFGVRRLYDYVVLVPALLVPALLEACTRPLARRRRLAAPALAGVVALLAVGAAYARVPSDRTLTRAAAGIAVIKRVKTFVPCDARMLSNARTAGTWEAWTGRRAVTEGHAPFLRPEVLERILPVLIAANEFFADPQANRAFLARERIQYLVVVKPQIWIGTNGGRVPAEGDAEAVASLPDVHQVFRDSRVAIFSVGSNAPTPGPGSPIRCPI